VTTVREALNELIQTDQQLETLKLAIQVCPDTELEDLVNLKLQLKNQRRQQAVVVSRLAQEEQRKDSKTSTTQTRHHAERQQAQSALSAARELLDQHRETCAILEDAREERTLPSPVATGPDIWAATEYWTDRSDGERARINRDAPGSLQQEEELRV